MSDWMVHLEFEEGTSSKFWRARVEGKTLYVNYGKIGANGQTQVKDFADNAGAMKEYNKLVAEKRKKGYVDTGAGGGDADDDEDVDEDADGDEGADEDADGDGDEDEPPQPPKKKAQTSAPAPVARSAAPAAPAKPAVPGHAMVLEAGSRRVEATLYLDGKTVRMESVESYATPEAAKKAYERLKKTLAGEGYK